MPRVKQAFGWETLCVLVPITVTRNCVAVPDAALIPYRLHRLRNATLICEFICRACFPFRSLRHFMRAFDRYFSPAKALHGRLLGFPTSEKMLVGRFPKASSKTWLGFATSSGLAGCVATRSSALVSEPTSGANSRPPKRMRRCCIPLQHLHVHLRILG